MAALVTSASAFLAQALPTVPTTMLAHDRSTNGTLPGPSQTLAGAELYDALYAAGYHKSPNTTRAMELLLYLQNRTRMEALFGPVHSVLDIGCSHGYAVERLWSYGYRASGVDVSTIAVAAARRVRGEPSDHCVHNCFVQSSVTTLPWPMHAFDAIMSSDVLEHVEPAEVDDAVKEISRVAAKLIVLKISVSSDVVDSRQKKYFEDMRKRNATVNTSTGDNQPLFEKQLPTNLHATSRKSDWWIDKFTKLGGWKLHSKLPIPRGPGGHLRTWICCSFVMTRPEGHGGHAQAKEQGHKDRSGPSSS